MSGITHKKVKKENYDAPVKLSENRIYHQELLMLGRKVDRLEQAILHIAQETGVKLKFDF